MATPATPALILSDNTCRMLVAATRFSKAPRRTTAFPYPMETPSMTVGECYRQSDASGYAAEYRWATASQSTTFQNAET